MRGGGVNPARRRGPITLFRLPPRKHMLRAAQWRLFYFFLLSFRPSLRGAAKVAVKC